jgi:penicillin-binding protein 1A
MSGPLRLLRTPADYEAALQEVDRLMGAAPGSADSDRCAVLGVLIAQYESTRTTMAPCSALDVILLEMEVRGRGQVDLARVLGSRSRASELLAGRRSLTPAMADRIASAWDLPRELLGPLSDKKTTGVSRRASAALAFVFFAASSFGGYAAWVTRDLPSVEGLQLAVAADDHVSLDEIPLHVRQAFLAAEDSDFYTHDGASTRGVLRAAIENVSNVLRGEKPNGGTTITEQLAKVTLLKNEPRSLSRRIRQAALGARLEAHFSKDDILEMYLNRIYFGNGVTGLSAASQLYFGAAPNELSLSEAALLAAMPAAPNAIRIDRPENLDRAKQRRDWVLTRMGDEAFITPAAESMATVELLGKRRLDGPP